MSLVTARNIALIRTAFRISPEQLGAMIGVSGRFIRYIEDGERDLPPTRAKEIERKLGITPEKLQRINRFFAEMTLEECG